METNRKFFSQLIEMMCSEEEEKKENSPYSFNLKNFINFLTVGRLLSGPIIFVSITFLIITYLRLILFLLSAITDFF